MKEVTCGKCQYEYSALLEFCPRCGAMGGTGRQPETTSAHEAWGKKAALERCVAEFARLGALFDADNASGAARVCAALQREAEEALKQSSSFEGEDSIRVGVIGEYSAGKSSFINSLLGEEICPTSDEATTSAVTFFRHQELGEVRFHRTDAAGKPVASIGREEYGHLARHGSGREDALYFSCTLDAPELAGLHLYDTPGFNNAHSSKGRRDTELTEKMLREVDAIFYVVDINAGSLGAYGLERLRPFKEKGTPIYLLLNKEDDKSPTARERILAQCKEEFDGFSGAMSYSSREEMHKRRSPKRQTLRGWLTRIREAGEARKREGRAGEREGRLKRFRENARSQLAGLQASGKKVMDSTNVAYALARRLAHAAGQGIREGVSVERESDTALFGLVTTEERYFLRWQPGGADRIWQEINQIFYTHLQNFVTMLTRQGNGRYPGADGFSQCRQELEQGKSEMESWLACVLHGNVWESWAKNNGEYYSDSDQAIDGLLEYSSRVESYATFLDLLAPLFGKEKEQAARAGIILLFSGEKADPSVAAFSDALKTQLEATRRSVEAL